MCGIAGFLSHKWNEAHLRSMTDCMVHRGPDAGGYWHDADAGIGLGHRRLSIIDLSEGANQPMTSSDGRYVIVFNGEVYNFRDIKKEILKQQPGLHFKTHSDTEVILESFRLWGAKAVDWWNGMFAAVIWDRGERSLFIVRDRLGKKPLYYAAAKDGLAFGSELKSLLTLPGLQRTIDTAAIYSYLHLGYIPNPRTIYNEVQKLDAGCYLEIRAGGMPQVKRYWSAAAGIEREVLSDEAVAMARLEELLHSSVAYRMISDVPFGTFLSGGIDSSLVTALAQHQSATPVNTFSIGFTESKFDESEYAAAVAAHLGTHHHVFRVSEKEAMHMVGRMTDAYDEPYADSSAMPTMLVSQLARQHVTMTLSGDGGDELFHGYGMYRWAERLHKPAVWAARHMIAGALQLGDNRRKRAATVFRVPDKAQLPYHIFSQEQYLFSVQEINRHFRLTEHWLPPFALPATRALTPAEQQSLFDINYYLKDDLLVKVDRASMQFSLETRAPLLDYRIVEFALNLAPSLKYRNGVQKYLLKEVLYKYVPAHLFDRPKWGFAVPLVKWLNTDLRYLVDDYLNDAVVDRYGWVSVPYVQQLKTAYRNGADYLYNRVWALIMLHKWAEEKATI